MNDDNVVKTIESGDTTIKIMYDFDPMNPRTEFDNLGTMVCFHRRGNYGDSGHGFDSPDELEDYLKENRVIAVHIRAYEHSGITIQGYVPGSTRLGYPFNDQWDSGWLGLIFVTYEKIRLEYGWKYITAARAKKIQGYLLNEVETYNQYLTGDVYGYEVTCNECGDSLDSCWGFYGHDHKESGLLEYATGHECQHCKKVNARLDAITLEV